MYLFTYAPESICIIKKQLAMNLCGFKFLKILFIKISAFEFLAGCNAMLRLVNVMQGVESITRHTIEYIEYEPE